MNGLCDKMNDEVYGGHDECCVNKRRNAVNCNASLQKVNVIRKHGENTEDDGVYNKNADAERKNDDGPRIKRKDRFQEAVQEREDERDKRDLDPCCRIEYKTRYIKPCEPERQRVSRDDNDEFQKPMHKSVYTYL